MNKFTMPPTCPFSTLPCPDKFACNCNKLCLRAKAMGRKAPIDSMVIKTTDAEDTVRVAA